MRKDKLENYIWAYIMILPLVIGITIFYILPFFQNLYFSFTNLGAFGKFEFIGLQNYKEIVKDPKMYKALKMLSHKNDVFERIEHKRSTIK